jgi:hypothetical protein
MAAFAVRAGLRADLTKARTSRSLAQRGGRDRPILDMLENRGISGAPLLEF